jgi:hypothetical protein
MGNGQTRKMSVEEAKSRLLFPPPEVYRRPVLESNAPWLVLGAFVSGFFMGSPRRLARLGGLGFKVFASPMVRRAVLPLIVNAARQKR